MSARLGTLTCILFVLAAMLLLPTRSLAQSTVNGAGSDHLYTDSVAPARSLAQSTLNGCVSTDAYLGQNGVALFSALTNASCVDGQVAGGAKVTGVGFVFYGSLTAINFSYDAYGNLHCAMTLAGRFTKNSVTINAYCYLKATNALNPTLPDTMGVLIEGASGATANTVLFTSGWVDRTGNGPSTDDFLTELPLIKGYISLQPQF